jgi:hypothetical protein
MLLKILEVPNHTVCPCFLRSCGSEASFVDTNSSATRVTRRTQGKSLFLTVLMINLLDSQMYTDGE